MTKGSKSFVAKIKEYIDSNYGDWNVSMSTFTGLVGFSSVYINREFKEIYGVHPLEYLQKIRLEKAKELIELGVPIGMAVHKCGFSTLRTFYRVFEQNTGISPGQFKQRSVKIYERFKDIVKLHDLRPLDYARKACDAIMLEYDPTRLPPVAVQQGITRYEYLNGMFLHSMFKVYKLCEKKKYFNYIHEWLDAVCDENGKMRKYKKHPSGSKVGRLDVYQPLRIFMPAYEMTGKKRYMIMTEARMNDLEQWPTAIDGIYRHGRYGQLESVCINDVYMLCPTACMYGNITGTGDPDYYKRFTYQPIAMYKRMRNPETGLLYHAWDENAEWADPVTGLSSEHWGRGMGYYIMGIIDMLEYLPENHEDYDELCNIARVTLDAIAKYQNESGRWYQLIDKCDLKENRLENSCSGMFIYSFAKAINMGIVDMDYANIAIRGYSGIIDTIEYGEKDEMILKDICEGVISCSDYLGYSFGTRNDLHGVGAFVLMCTEIEKLLNNM